MRSLAAWLHDHRRLTVAAWALVLVGLFLLSGRLGPAYKFDVNIGQSESVVGFDILQKHSPASKGDSLTFVWSDTDGALKESTAQHVKPLLAKIAASPNVTAIVSPLDDPRAAMGLVSPDGRTAMATILMDGDSSQVPASSVNAVKSLVTSGNEDAPNGTRMALAGQAVMQANPPGVSGTEGFAMLFAGVVLLLAFGSFLAAGMPLVTAGVSLGAAFSAVAIVSHVFSIPSFSPQLVSLICLGIGIDYALFIVSRHHAGLMRGKDVRSSIIDSLDSSGRAVVFAGFTVMISLLGLFLTGVGFLSGLAVAASIGVLFTMVCAITLTPALLGFMGMRVLGRKARRELEVEGPHDEERSTRWGGWAERIQRRPWLFITSSVLILLILAIPAFSMRLGSADQGSDPPGSTTRQAYEMISAGFGPGFNAPLLFVTSEGHAGDAGIAAAAVKTTKGIVAVTPPVPTADGSIASFTAIPAYEPQSIESSDLVKTLRTEVLPKLDIHRVYITGIVPVFDDFGTTLQDKLPLFLFGVLGLSALLLLVAFRSIIIPLKAVLMNLLVAAAAFGVIVAVFQWGWGLGVTGVERTGPIESFLPVILLSVLFGLSMDYQVFLVSRMKEEYTRTGDNTKAVTLGLAETGRVITSAAMIMILVFASFVFGGERIIKIAGLGLAVAIFLDAFLVRSILVPALMQVLGKWNWWLPSWLDRILPRVSIEPSVITEASMHANDADTELDALIIEEGLEDEGSRR